MVRAFGKIMPSIVHIIGLYNIQYHVNCGPGCQNRQNFVIQIKSRVTEGNCVQQLYLNKLKIALKYEIGKVRNFSNGNVATCKNVVQKW